MKRNASYNPHLHDPRKPEYVCLGVASSLKELVHISHTRPSHRERGKGVFQDHPVQKTRRTFGPVEDTAAFWADRRFLIFPASA